MLHIKSRPFSGNSHEIPTHGKSNRNLKSINIESYHAIQHHLHVHSLSWWNNVHVSYCIYWRFALPSWAIAKSTLLGLLWIEFQETLAPLHWQSWGEKMILARFRLGRWYYAIQVRYSIPLKLIVHRWQIPSTSKIKSPRLLLWSRNKFEKTSRLTRNQRLLPDTLTYPTCQRYFWF